MVSLLATIITIIAICVLMRLDPGEKRVSKAACVPFIWLLIASSRPISAWLTLRMPGTETDQYIEGSPLDRNVLTFLLVLALILLWQRRVQLLPILRANVPLTLYFVFCLLSLTWSDYPFVVLKRWIRSVGDVAMVLVIVTDPNWNEALKRVLTRIACIVLPLSILFIRFYPSLGRAYSRGGAPSWTGVGTDKNALGMICMLFGTTLLWRGLTTYRSGRSKVRNRRLFCIGILFLMVLYLLLVANSQTALACFMMASLLIVLTHFSPTFRKPVLVTCLLICMLGVSFCVLFLGIGGGALSAIGRDASLTGRTDVWKTVLPYAVNQWVGSGYENFWIGERIQLFNRLLGGLNQAHNGYIEVYLNIGWVGIVFLVAVIIRGYRNTMKSLRRNPEAGRLKLAFFLICLVYNFTEASFKMMSPVWLMFLWAIMAAPQTDVPEAATVRKVGAGTEALSAWRSHEPSNLSAFPFEICGLAL